MQDVGHAPPGAPIPTRRTARAGRRRTRGPADAYDLVIVGMGSGGMPAAEFALRLGLRVAVVERDRFGGDCLWRGCVPSKALLGAAKIAHHVRTSHRWGLPLVVDQLDTSGVFERVRAVQHQIATGDDNPDRFAALGAELHWGDARVAGPHEVEVEGRRLHTRFVLICTGSRPAVPAIPGLDEAGYLTSETLFALTRVPTSLVVVGGGPIAVEMAQAMARLGSQVTLLEMLPTILAREEPELVRRLVGVLAAEGVDIRTDVRVEEVGGEAGHRVVTGSQGGEARRWEAEEILVATGRKPNTEGLGLEELAIAVGRSGIEVDGAMRTAVRSVYAAGDVTGRYLFTHSAAHDAVRAVRDMFFPGRGKVAELVPWCTFTDPELAHVGLTEAEARRDHGDEVRAWSVELDHSDRARAEGAEAGILKVVTVKDRIAGAHLLSPGAGEMVHELALAIHKGMKLNELASLVHVYPTYSTSIAQLAAGAAYEAADRFRWATRLSHIAGRWR